MRKDYTIPELLKMAGLRGYTPRLSGAVNALLSARTEIEYQTALKEATLEINGYQVSQVFDSSEMDGYTESSHFKGVPIYMPLILEGIPESSEDLLLESAVMDIENEKNIIETETQGRDEPVLEFINNGSHTIYFRGLLCNNGPDFPREQLEQLNVFLSYKKPIRVIHEKLNLLGIHEIVIKSSSLPHTEFTNCQQYSFTARSSVPTELIISNV